MRKSASCMRFCRVLLWNARKTSLNQAINHCVSIDCKASSVLSPQREDKTADDDVGDGERQQKLPAEAHQLVIAEARHRRPHPDVEKQETKYLGHEPEDGENRLHDRSAKGRDEMPKRAGRAAEEKQRGDAAYGNHVGVLCHKEHRELHGT